MAKFGFVKVGAHALVLVCDAYWIPKIEDISNEHTV